MPLLPLFPLVSLTAALSTIYLLSTRFTHHDQRYFSCPYCLCFPLVLLHADLSLQFTFSQLVFTHPETPCYNTSHARRQGEKKKLPLFFPCLAHCCPTIDHRFHPPCSAILFHVLTAFVFPCLLLSGLQSSFSTRLRYPLNTILNATFSCPHCLCFRCLAQCSPRSAIYLLSTRFHAPSKPHTQRYFFNAPAAVVFPLSCLMLSCRHLNSVSRTL
jgi:hypothetical protein